VPPSNTHPRVVVYNTHNYKLRNFWWYACSQVDVAKLKEEIRRDQFSILRAKGLSTEERERLRDLVSIEQKRRLERARRLTLPSL